MQRDKVMADAQHEGREFSPVASAWCASACRCFLTGSHNGGFSSAGRWSVVWMKMVLRSLSKANEGFLCSEGCYVQSAAGLLCNVRALAFRLISWPEPSRLGPLRSMVCDSVSPLFSLLFSLMDSSFMERFLPAGCDFGGLVFNGG